MPIDSAYTQCIPGRTLLGSSWRPLASDVSVAQLKGDGPAPRERDHWVIQCPALRPGSRRPETASDTHTGPASARGTAAPLAGPALQGRLAGAAGRASVGRPAILCSHCQKRVTGIPGCLLRCNRPLYFVLVALSLRPHGLPMSCLLVLSLVALTLCRPGFSQGNQQMLAEGLTPTGALSVESLSGEPQSLR